MFNLNRHYYFTYRNLGCLCNATLKLFIFYPFFQHLDLILVKTFNPVYDLLFLL